MDQHIADYVEALEEDFERKGSLHRAEATDVGIRRGLGPEALAEGLAIAEARGILPAQPIRSNQEVSTTGNGGDSSAEAYVFWEMPDRLYDHGVMTAAEEVVLGRRVQLGAKAEAELPSVTDPVKIHALEEMIADGHEARNTFVTRNVRLAKSIAKLYVGSCGDLTMDDLLQEASLGLIRAAEKFDPGLGYKFSTYATWWIRQSVTRAIANTASLVRLPVHVTEELRRVTTYARKFEVRNGRPATLAEIAEGAGFEQGRVRALFDWGAPALRLDTPVDVGGSGGGATLGELALTALGPGPEEECVQRILLDSIRTTLTTIHLDPRAIDILDQRHGLATGTEMTLEAIGQQYHVSRERIRQVEKKTVEKLRSIPRVMEMVGEYLTEG